ncbi:putative rubber elongation factor [Helianthus annuus]|nr:putative rubber elongation factor [Helianthus annuus]
MASNEFEIEQSSTGLKYLWLFKKIVARSLLLLLNVYEYAKENSVDFKATIVAAEDLVVFTFGPLYQKLTSLPEDIMEFVDDTFDKYASSRAKEFVTKYNTLIYTTKPIVKKQVIATQTIISPLLTTTIFLLKTTKYLLRNITPKPEPLFGKKDQTPLQNTLDAAKSLVPDLANQAVDATKSLVGGLPLVGNVAQTLTNPTNLANQIADTTNSLVKENPILEVVSSAAESSGNATKSQFGGLPLVGDVAQTLTNPTNLANQIADTTNSLVKENPILEAVSSAAESSSKTTKSLFGGLPTNPLDLANQITNTANSLVKDNPILDAVNSAAQNTLDTAASIVGDLPIVGDIAQSLPTNPADLANQVLDTTTSLINDNPLAGAINSAAENIGNIGNNTAATGTKAALQAAYTTMKLAMIPVIAQLWYELMKKYPTLAQLSEFILPVVEVMCELYNKAVAFMDGKGYSIAGYLPLIPIDEMKAAYKLVKTSKDGLAAVGDLVGVDANKGLSAVGDILGVNK